MGDWSQFEALVEKVQKAALAADLDGLESGVAELDAWGEQLLGGKTPQAKPEDIQRFRERLTQLRETLRFSSEAVASILGTDNKRYAASGSVEDGTPRGVLGRYA